MIEFGVLLPIAFGVGVLVGAIGIGGVLLIPALASFARLGMHGNPVHELPDTLEKLRIRGLVIAAEDIGESHHIGAVGGERTRMQCNDVGRRLGGRDLRGERRLFGFQFLDPFGQG